MADEIDVKVKATTQPLKEGMDRAAKDVGDGLDDIRAAFRRVDDQLETHARHVDEWASRTRTSVDRQGSAMGMWVIQWNQGLDLAQKAMHAFESAWDLTMGRVIARGEALDDLGKRTATPVEQLSAISFAADQAGIDLGSLTNGYRALSRNITEAATTGTDANKLFTETLGFTRSELEALQTMRPHEAILAVGKALNQYEDGAGKAAVAQTLFGRSFEPILQLLRDTPGEFERNVELAERLGLVMSGDTASAAGELSDSYDALKAAADGFFSRVLGDSGLMRDLAGIVDETTDRVIDFRDSLSPEELQNTRDRVYELATALRDVASVLATIITRAAQAAVDIASIARSWADYRETEGDLVAARARLGAKLIERGVASTTAPSVNNVPGQRIVPQFPAEEVGPPTSADGTFFGPDVPTSAPNMGPQPVTTKGQLTVPDAAATKAAGAAASKARQEEYQALLRDQQQALAAERDNAEKRLEIVTEYSERIKARFGEESQEFDRQKLVQIQAEEQAKQQRDRIQLAKVEFTKQQLLAELEEERKTLEHKKAMGEISANEELDALRELYERRYLVILEAIQRERELTGNDPVRQGQLDQEEQQAGASRGESDMEVLREKQMLIKQSFDEVFSAIGQSFDRSILGMIQGTQTLGQAVANMGQNILAQMISMGIQMVARWAAMQAAKLLISRLTDQSEVASMQSAQAQKTAAQAPEVITQIMNNAYGAASGAANAMSSIPYVGPILAVANAAAMLAMVGGYAANVSAAGGMDEVGPRGAFAELHPKEMVLSAGLAERVRNMTATPREMGTDDMPTTSGSRQPTVIQVSMIDTRGAEEFFERYGGKMADSLERTGRLRQGS